MTTDDALFSSYRVLDVGGLKSLLAGRLFVLLGAEVIQIEPPGGGDFRSAQELGCDLPLSWIAYGAGRRSVEVDLTTPAGRANFFDLVRSADFLIDDGRLAGAGLSSAEVAAINPWLIQVVMTGFGTRGAKQNYAESDLVLWAASGVPWQNGSEFEEPLRIAVPQAWHHAAADGVVGAMIAHFDRMHSGRGQVVGTSVLRSATTATLAAGLADLVGHPEFRLKAAFGLQEERTDVGRRRPLDLSGSGAASGRTSWQALDGLVELHLAMGPATGHFTNALFAWIAEDGGQGAGIDWDWSKLHERVLAGEISDRDMDDARTTVRQFLATRTVMQLAEATVARRLLIAPCFDTSDLVGLPQFATRGVFGMVTDSAGGRWQVPKSFAQIDGRPIAVPQSLPTLGELSVEQALRRRDRPPLSAPDEAPSRPPFAGLRVVDLSWVVAGPMMGRVLADYGAEVIRVESRKRPDPTRRMAPFYHGADGLENTAIYQNVNLGKTGIAIDLNCAEGREVLHDLVRSADVVIESFAPGQMEKWGLDYAALRALKPSIVMLSTSLAGQTGPWSRIAGFGNIGSALSGILRLVSSSDGAIRGPIVPYTDFVAPRFGLAVLLAALDRRHRTGEGARIDVSQIECGILCIATAVARYSADGVVTVADGNRDAAMAPHGVFRCRDAPERQSPWVAIAVRNDADWAKLAHVIDRADLAADVRYATAGQRLAHAALIEDIVGDWAIHHDAREVEALLQGIGVPAHVVAAAADLARDPHVAAEGIFARFSDDRLGEIVVEASRYDLSRTPPVPPRAAPTFGRDTRYVLANVLGYSPERIDRLDSSGVLS